MKKISSFWAVPVIFLGILFFLTGKTAKKTIQVIKNDPETDDPALSSKYNLHKIPDNLNNYRSSQMSLKDLEYFIKTYNVKNVVRLNGNGVDGKIGNKGAIINRNDERALCKKLGCNFYYVNPYQKYVAGKGYTKSIKETSDVLKQGNTLIHCRWGADRTGGMVGAYLKNNNIITDLDKLWQYTTQYNSWNTYLKNHVFYGTGYDKYADGFYPLTLLKKSKWHK